MKENEYKEMVLKWEKAKIKNMIGQIDKKEPIAVFNAKKSLYVMIPNDFLGNIIKFLTRIMLKRKFKDLECKKS